MRQRLLYFFTGHLPVEIVIALNALLLALMSFKELDAYHQFFVWADALMMLYFVVEVVVKIAHFGWKTYWSRRIDRFDFLITMASLPSVVLLFHHIDAESFSFIFVFRLIRLVRFCELIWFIPRVDLLITGIRRALRASLFVFIAFSGLSIFIALLSCRLFRDFSPEHFGNPVQSMYSIFKIFTVEGWYVVPDEIAAKQSEAGAFFTKLYFSAVVLLGGMLGFSIVTALFVDGMVKDNHDYTHQKLRHMEHQLEEIIKRLPATTDSASQTDSQA